MPPQEFQRQSIHTYKKETTQTLIQIDICTPTFTVALFTIAKIQKQPKCPLKDEWIKKIWYNQSEWPSSKNLQTINAGEGVEKREPSCTVGGNVN